MNIIPQKEKDDYIKRNHLQNSFLPVNILIQCRGTIPAQKDVGIINGDKIFFEEGISSFKKRHYKLQNEVTSWNLVLNNQLVNKDFLLEHKDEITLTGEYSFEFLLNFFNTKNKKMNPLKPPISEDEKKVRYQKLLTKDEIKLVNEFIKRMRAYNKLTKEQQTDKIK